MKKTLQVDTHVSNKQMCLLDYVIRLAVGVISLILHTSAAFPPDFPQLMAYLHYSTLLIKSFS